MPSKYWIKLYHEILHDRKVVTLDNHLWRRWIEILLLAGDTDELGFLPELDDIAFTLRVSPDETETDLNELIRLGFLEFRDGRYFVKNFAKRQEPMPKGEYMRRLRQDRKKDVFKEPLPSSDQSVTIGNADTDTDKITDTDTEEDRGADPFDKIQRWLEILTGLPATQPDIPALQELAAAGIIKEDIQGALQWRKDEGLKPVRTMRQLKEGIITNKNKRIQSASARKPSSSKPRKNAGKIAALRARLESGEYEDGF